MIKNLILKVKVSNKIIELDILLPGGKIGRQGRPEGREGEREGGKEERKRRGQGRNNSKPYRTLSQ